MKALNQQTKRPRTPIPQQMNLLLRTRLLPLEKPQITLIPLAMILKMLILTQLKTQQHKRLEQLVVSAYSEGKSVTLWLITLTTVLFLAHLNKWKIQVQQAPTRLLTNWTRLVQATKMGNGSAGSLAQVSHKVGGSGWMPGSSFLTLFLQPLAILASKYKMVRSKDGSQVWKLTNGSMCLR